MEPGRHGATRSRPREPRRPGEGVPRERSRLIHGAQGRDILHDLPPSDVGSDGHAAADDLSEAREIGGDVEETLG